MSIRETIHALALQNSFTEVPRKGKETNSRRYQPASGEGSILIRPVRDHGAIALFQLEVEHDLPFSFPESEFWTIGCYTSVAVSGPARKQSRHSGILYTHTDDAPALPVIYQAGTPVQGVFLLFHAGHYSDYLRDHYSADVDLSSALNDLNGLPCPPEIAQILRQIRTFAGSASEHLEDIFFESKFNELLSIVVQHHLDGSSASARTRAKADDLQAVAAVAEHIDTHLQENPGLIALAQLVYMSPSKLKALFKEVTGYTITEYRARRRIYVAQDLLLHTDLPIREIADRCGYRKPDNFNILFEKHMNMSPREYRASKKGGPAR